MYASAEIHLWRQRSAEIRHEVAANRLQRKLRADRKCGSRLAQDPKWEIARYVGLLVKRLRTSS